MFAKQRECVPPDFLRKCHEWPPTLDSEEETTSDELGGDVVVMLSEKRKMIAYCLEYRR